MSLPRWPPAWIEDAPLGDEVSLAVLDGVELLSAERADGQVLISLTWPEGRRWIRIDPSGVEAPTALRAGELAEEPELARQIDDLWERALTLAKKATDGELRQLLPRGGGTRRRRRWRRK